MFLQIDGSQAINMKYVNYIIKEDYENDSKGNFGIRFIYPARDFYSFYANKIQRDIAFNELLRLIDAIEWKSD